MAHILIVGKSFSGLKNFIIENGHTYTILQDKKTTKKPDQKLKNRIVTSFADDSFLLDAKTLHETHSVNAVITIYENYVVPTARIAAGLKLPGLTPEAAIACTDKEIMRTKFSHSTIPVSPAFQVVNTREDLIQFAAAHEFPLILKPANLVKSLFVTKNDTLDQLLKNYDDALEHAPAVYAKYAPDSTPKFIVEEFLEGSIHSVDAFVDAEGIAHVLNGVVDYQTGMDVGYNDNFHYSRVLPSTLSDKDRNAIRETAALGCTLLGMTSSPAHVEIILTKNGPRIVEIGARNGGYRERMHRLAEGVNIPKNALALALNEPLNLIETRHNSVGVFELFTKQQGAFVNIENEEALRTLPSLNYLSIKSNPGDLIGKASEGYKASAVVILTNDDAEQFARDREFLDTQVHVVTR